MKEPCLFLFSRNIFDLYFTYTFILFSPECIHICSVRSSSNYFSSVQLLETHQNLLICFSIMHFESYEGYNDFYASVPAMARVGGNMFLG